MIDQKTLFRGVATAFAVATLSVAGIAEAHPRLVSASPVPNANVTATNRLVLNFSERLVGALSGGELYVVVCRLSGLSQSEGGKLPNVNPEVYLSAS